MAAIYTQGIADYNFDNHNSELTINTKDFAFGGKMLEAQYKSLPIDNVAHGSVAEFQNHIKETLSLELAREMIKRRLIEFTVSHDASHINTIYRARCCVMPDEQVKIVRTIIDKR